MNKIIVHDYDNILGKKLEGYHLATFEVDAWCVGGTEGIRAYFYLEDMFCEAHGDDGHWWLKGACHVQWVPKIKEAIAAVAPKEQPKPKPKPLITIYGSSGEVRVDAEGYPVSAELTDDDYRHFARFNVAEYLSWLSSKGIDYDPDSELSIDILDIGGWTKDGVYAPPYDDHREEWANPE